jgi:hypothetical protein
MSYKPLVVVLLTLILGACTRKPKTETPAVEVQAPIADPTPPGAPNSEQVPADLTNLPASITLAVGGIASEGENEGIEVQENMRVFRSDVTAPEIVAFYTTEMKNRGWTGDNQVAHSSRMGLSIQEYRRAGTEALYLIISEPEDPQSSDPTKAKRYVVLLPAKVKTAKR